MSTATTAPARISSACVIGRPKIVMTAFLYGMGPLVTTAAGVTAAEATGTLATAEVDIGTVWYTYLFYFVVRNRVAMDSKCKPVPNTPVTQASNESQVTGDQQNAEHYYTQRKSFTLPRSDQKQVDQYYSQRRSFAVPR